MKKYIYPAIFHKEKVGGYSITFPDLKGCFSEGETIEEAFEMAKDALGIFLYTLEKDDQDIPLPTDPNSYDKKDNSFVALVEVDLLDYKRKHDNKAVKKTLTIPRWLNYMAEKEGVNFFNILQLALKEKLHIQNQNIRHY